MRVKFIKKRWLLFLVMIMCLVVIFVVCGGGSGSESVGFSMLVVENEYKEKYDLVVMIIIVWGIDFELKFKNGELMENNVVIKWVKDKFGIEIKFLWFVIDMNNVFVIKFCLVMFFG